MEIIVKYFVEAIKALLALFGVTADEEFMSNLESMFDNMKDAADAPETEAGSVKL